PLNCTSRRLAGIGDFAGPFRRSLIALLITEKQLLLLLEQELQFLDDGFNGCVIRLRLPHDTSQLLMYPQSTGSLCQSSSPIQFGQYFNQAQHWRARLLKEPLVPAILTKNCHRQATDLRLNGVTQPVTLRQSIKEQIHQAQRLPLQPG